MIKQVLPIQFGNGLQNYRWIISYADFDRTQANTTIQTLQLADAASSPPYNTTKYSTMPQGSLVVAFRIKATTAFTGTSITHAYVDLGYPANTAVSYSANTEAITSSNHTTTSYDAEAAVADANYLAGFCFPPSATQNSGSVAMAPGDAAFGLTISMTLAGANWTALTAGQLEVDLLLWIPSMGELSTSQYYTTTPSAGNP